MTRAPKYLPKLKLSLWPIRGVICVFTVASTLISSDAGAADVPTVAAASTSRDADAAAAMERGLAAYGKGDLETALREYEQAKLLAPAANVPYRYAAVAYAALGRHREAVENLKIYLEKKPNVSDADAVRVQIKTLTEEHLPAHVKLLPASPRISISVDGAAATNEARSIELLPGEHVFVARTDHGDAERRVLRVVGGTDATVQFDLREAVLGSSASTDGTAMRTAGKVTAAVGAAALVSGLLLDLIVLGPKVRKFDEAATTGVANRPDLQRDARTWQTGVGVTYFAGGAIALTGLALWLFAPNNAPKSQSGAARLVPTYNGAGWTF
jgi:tetratricopeptide (TPR) repeat protein